METRPDWAASTTQQHLIRINYPRHTHTHTYTPTLATSSDPRTRPVTTLPCRRRAPFSACSILAKSQRKLLPNRGVNSSAAHRSQFSYDVLPLVFFFCCPSSAITPSRPTGGICALGTIHTDILARSAAHTDSERLATSRTSKMPSPNHSSASIISRRSSSVCSAHVRAKVSRHCRPLRRLDSKAHKRPVSGASCQQRVPAMSMRRRWG